MSLFGSAAETVILFHALWLMVAGQAAWGITGLAYITTHLSFFYWVIDLAYAVFPDGFVSYLLTWPVVLFYPVRIVVSILIGIWAFRKARMLKDQGQ